jgi:hypothetical protein
MSDTDRPQAPQTIANKYARKLGQRQQNSGYLQNVLTNSLSSWPQPTLNRRHPSGIESNIITSPDSSFSLLSYSLMNFRVFN